MSTNRSERKAVGLLATMILTGIGLLTVPWFLTPPAYLDLALRDVAFGSDLSAQNVVLTESTTGKTKTAAIRRIGNVFVARIGRINSGSRTYTARIPGYQPGTARVQAAALQTVRVPVELTPTFGRLQVSTFNAMRSVDPIAATVKEGNRKLTQEPQRVVTIDLPAGKHRLTAEAPGFCGFDREIIIRPGRLTRAAFPLSPDLADDEIARFVLGWRDEPRDLDTHFRKADETRFPNQATVFFENKNGRLANGDTFARLDVDETYPGRYETLTVRDAAVGDFRYFIHVYQGTGTIADAGAMVQVYTKGCQVRTFTPPPNCGVRIWNVATVHYGGDRVELVERQVCETEGTLAVPIRPELAARDRVSAR
ncbi:MAG TPA: hypothetical protein VEK79_14100 [Thermoanaerobaculia bacterium]|nr:hypothetical protein [Thermoanaerobaculia bacterium]